MLTQYQYNSMRGACIPGYYKLAVDVEGNYHMCEKINGNHKLGNVDSAIDMDAQIEIMDSFISTVNKTCSTCNIKNLCNLCYVSAETKNSEFKIEKSYCEKMREGVASSLSEYYSILETNNLLFEELRF
uniref:SPASM domain-containing protein n=1 Tax=Candidatus Enterococcus willemsii TaxID=1857215 RepID=UPI00403FB3BC